MSYLEDLTQPSRYEPPPIVITLKLKRQQRDRDGNFYMTFKGERIKVTDWRVRFYAKTLREVAESFKEEECLGYTIKYGEKFYGE